MALKPWFNVVVPREDLLEGKPLDASEFAVHLDQVRDERAPKVYQNPREFFARTYLTQDLSNLASEAIRRLSGERTQANAVFNMTTQFGGGKTHALTLLYHLAKHGADADGWSGVQVLLQKAGMPSVPRAEVAVFVGTEFDSIQGRGGANGEPLRMTPWGEIAYQLGGAAGFEVVARHDEQMIAPAGDVIRLFLPKDRPCLVLMDELLNYVSRNRKSGMAAQMYNFLQGLLDEARGRDGMVLAVSIPASELEMNAEDQSDYNRFKKLLDRLSRPIMMAAETETSEIIRRRLFEWDERAVTSSGKVMLPKEALETCRVYGDWVIEHRQQLPDWFPVDRASEQFADTYPFHPTAISVFERKWQALPRFQQTRGVLRLLALWVSRAYSEGYKGAHKDPLLGLGTAPLEDPAFRAAVFEQLGEHRLEAAVTTDIAGRKDSHAMRLDSEAVDTLKKARLHRKVATTIFFESNGGQVSAKATVPEIRLAVGEPEMDIGNIETVLGELESTCYFLSVERNKYEFGLKPNLIKILSDRLATIQPARIDERVRAEVRKVFEKGQGVDRVFFPERSGQIPDVPSLTLVILPPDLSASEGKLPLELMDKMTREYGSSARTFKSALVWCVPDMNTTIYEDARKGLAWEAIEDEGIDLDEGQRRQLTENLERARRDLRESVWRTYNRVSLLDKDGQMQIVELGLIHSSAAETMAGLIISRLQREGQIEEGIGPAFLVRNWPPALNEWSTKGVRNAFFASPLFPRLLKPESIKETIARGVSQGLFGYVGKVEGRYEPCYVGDSLAAYDIEISDDMYIVSAAEAQKCKEPSRLAAVKVIPATVRMKFGEEGEFHAVGEDQHGDEIAIGDVEWSANSGEIYQDGRFVAGQTEAFVTVTAQVGEVSAKATVVVVPEDNRAGPGSDEGHLPPLEQRIVWNGEIPAQKWSSFYMKVLTKLVQAGGLKITVKVEAKPDNGAAIQKAQEMMLALRELGISDEVVVE